MPKEVGEVGQGFLTKEGVVKSKETLASEEKSTSKSRGRKAADDKPGETFSARTVTNALGAERSRFSEAANAEAARLNRAQDTVEKAEALAKEQLAKTRELKQAVKEDDTERAAALRKELTKLDNKRNELAESNEKQVREESLGTERELRVGNKAVGKVKTPAPRVTESPRGKTNSEEDIDARIETLKRDVDDLKTQRQEVKQVRAELKETVKKGNASIDKVEKDAIRSISAAESKADEVAEAIKKAGPKVVEANTLDSVVVQTLTQ